AICGVVSRVERHRRAVFGVTRDVFRKDNRGRIGLIIKQSVHVGETPPRKTQKLHELNISTTLPEPLNTRHVRALAGGKSKPTFVLMDFSLSIRVVNIAPASVVDHGVPPSLPGRAEACPE